MGNTHSDTCLRAELEPLPDRMKRLPVRRGYPVPWFVEWVDADRNPMLIGEGEPAFHIMSGVRFSRALTESHCWVCGGRLGRYSTFVVGPMCVVNRTSAEPPSHLDCAEWSARNCPFLARPHAKRRAVTEPVREVAGIMIERNPGVTAVWTTRRPSVFNDGKGGLLFDIGEPEHVSWWAEGRPATRAEVDASIESGLPVLMDVAVQEGDVAVEVLHAYVKQAEELLPV
jgi:hypothetical protein